MKTNNAWTIFGRIVLAIALLAGAGFIGFRLGVLQNIDLSELPAVTVGDLSVPARMTRHGMVGAGSIFRIVFGILLLGLIIRLFTHTLFGFRRPFFHRRMRPWMHPAWDYGMPPEMRAWYKSAYGEEPPGEESPEE